ncbi:MAG: hypothetical protein FIA94_09595 [Nitrospirae bacterium]|nr:hypothetical protein [Nitrospirota bacterium]
MRRTLGEDGFIKTLLGLALLVALIYVGLTFSRPYYRYYQLGSHTSDFLKTDIGEINTIRKHVLDDAAELGVPLADANLSVMFDKDKKTVTVKGTWTDSVDLFGYYQKDVDFVMEETY